MKVIAAISAVFVLLPIAVGQQPDLQTTIDFMNQMVKPDGRQLALVGGSKCDMVIISSYPVKLWLLLISEHRFMVGSDTDDDDAKFPRYAKLNLTNVDPTSIESRTVGFSTKYVERFWDEHADICKGEPVNSKCEYQEMLAFDKSRSDITAVGLHTVDLQPAIERGGLTETKRPEDAEIKGSTYMYNPNVHVDRMGLSFSDEDRAQRFVTAFKHAVELCGGHASTFAPTPGRKD